MLMGQIGEAVLMARQASTDAHSLGDEALSVSALHIAHNCRAQISTF
jgi:acyl-[acyl carrier protein]--UDP-N-acetylglucosamine O-acyltransferase